MAIKALDAVEAAIEKRKREIVPTPKELEAVTAAIESLPADFVARVEAGEFDDLSVREVRVKACEEVEKLIRGDQARLGAASIVSVIVWIVRT